MRVLPSKDLARGPVGFRPFVKASMARVGQVILEHFESAARQVEGLRSSEGAMVERQREEDERMAVGILRSVVRLTVFLSASETLIVATWWLPGVEMT